MTIPSVTKRAYEQRVFEVNLGPRMRSTDSIGQIDSIEAEDGIAIDDSTITHTSAVVSFRTSGGTPGQTYEVRIRFRTSGSPTQMLEALIHVVIVFEKTN